MSVTMSVFRASVGGYVGAAHVHPALIDVAREAVDEAREAGEVTDGYVARCGDDIGLVLLHAASPGAPEVRRVALDAFGRAATAGVRLHQHGANGGPHVDGVELPFHPRPSEPVVCFFSDGAAEAAWNPRLYAMFADPFNTPGLVVDPLLGRGFRFSVGNPDEIDRVFDLPSDLYRLLHAAAAGACIREVRSNATGELAAAVSGGSDPILIVRCESPFPALDDVLATFDVCYGTGERRPLVPVSANGDSSVRPAARAVGLGFQVGPDRLVGPRDLLGDPAFDGARCEAAAAQAYARRQGPFAAGFVARSVAARN